MSDLLVAGRMKIRPIHYIELCQDFTVLEQIVISSTFQIGIFSNWKEGMCECGLLGRVEVHVWMLVRVEVDCVPKEGWENTCGCKGMFVVVVDGV